MSNDDVKHTELATPNLDELRRQVNDYVLGTECDHQDCDCRHYIFESAIEAYFGKDIWTYINSKRS